MKKIVSLILIAACLLSMTSCSTVAVSKPSVSPSTTAPAVQSSTAAASVSPEASSKASETVAAPSASEAATIKQGSSGGSGSGETIEIKGIKLDKSADTFFGEDAATAIQKLSVLLLSAARAEYSIKTPYFAEEDPDAKFEWAMIYQHINEYAEQDKDLKVQDGGSVVLTDAQMAKYFQFDFCFYKELPELNTDYDIKYDKAAKTYTVGRSDFADVTFAITGFKMSKASSAADPSMSAMVTITPSDNSNPIMVEIAANKDSKFGFSIQSVTEGE